jgi:hypothetical protein
MAETVRNLDADTHTSFAFRDVRYDQGVPDGVFSVANLDHN